MTHRWEPWHERPGSLVVPVRIDATGRAGPTRGQAQRGRWRQSAHGWYVPAEVDGSLVEQRILEQAVRLPASGAVTAWAGLRWRGATFFDGTCEGGRRVLPVPLLPGGVGNLGRDPRAAVSREQLAPYEREEVAGIGCTTVTRATFDEMRRVGTLWGAVTVLDMVAAAGLLRVTDMADYAVTRSSWEGVPRVREAIGLASDHSRSPPETTMRLIWEVLADLPPVLCNRAVFDRCGRLLGYPDLLDPVAGVVGEYAGADHRDPARHARDVARETELRDHGLECFTVVGDDLADRARVARRMQRTRDRARFLPEGERAWTLDPPEWWTRPLHR